MIARKGVLLNVTCGTGSLLGLIQQSARDELKFGQLARYDIPHNFRIDRIVAVDQPIAERNDGVTFIDAVKELWMPVAEPRHRLSNDLQLALAGGAQHEVSFVVFLRSTASEPMNRLGCRGNVVEKLASVTLHRSARELPRHA